MYISDFGNNVIRAVTPQGLIYTIAGSGGYGNTGDGGPAIDATFDGPTAVYVNNAGYIYIADGNNSEIREVTPITFPVAGVKQVNQASSFNIYPDPAVGGKFTVNLFAQQASMVIMVTNAIGDCVYNSPVNGSQVQIDLSGNAQGLYLVQVTSPDGIFTRKVVLE
jgi:hypothetical protein